MLDGEDDIAVADEILDLSGVGEGGGRVAVGEENHGVGAGEERGVGDGVGGEGAGDDSRPASPEEIECCSTCGGIVVDLTGEGEVGSGWGGGRGLRGVPGVDHELAVGVRVGGKGVRAGGVDEIEGFPTDRVNA